MSVFGLVMRVRLTGIQRIDVALPTEEEARSADIQEMTSLDAIARDGRREVGTKPRAKEEWKGSRDLTRRDKKGLIMATDEIDLHSIARMNKRCFSWGPSKAPKLAATETNPTRERVMPSKILCLLWLTATLNVTAALADGAAAQTPAPTPGGIRISIKNEYDVKLDFGPLGKGSREGTDVAEGALKRQGREYVGIVTARVGSDQEMTGLMTRCGKSHYEDLQQLRVIGHPVGGFNEFQTVAFNQATSTGRPSNASNEYLRLEFVPETMTSQQPSLRLPKDMLPDLVISCHTLIDTRSGIAFLPLNDSRWTMDGGGYIIVLPSSGVLNYTDNTLAVSPGAVSPPTVPFNAKKSLWTIQVERLP